MFLFNGISRHAAETAIHTFCLQFTFRPSIRNLYLYYVFYVFFIFVYDQSVITFGFECLVTISGAESKQPMRGDILQRGNNSASAILAVASTMRHFMAFQNEFSTAYSLCICKHVSISSSLLEPWQKRKLQLRR
jgi:hypothetical protein